MDGFPELGGPELDAVSRCGLVRAEHRGIINPLPPLTGRAPAHTVQGAVGPCESTNTSNTKLERPYFVVNLCLCVHVIMK